MSTCLDDSTGSTHSLVTNYSIIIRCEMSKHNVIYIISRFVYNVDFDFPFKQISTLQPKSLQSEVPESMGDISESADHSFCLRVENVTHGPGLERSQLFQLQFLIYVSSHLSRAHLS